MESLVTEVSQLKLKLQAAKQKHYSLLFTELSQFLSVSFHPRPPVPLLQSVCSALWGLCGGHLSRRTGDACRGRCVPPALLHLQRLFLPPADRRPLCPQGGTATVCQRGLPPVCGQPDLFRHRYRYRLCTVCECLYMYTNHWVKMTRCNTGLKKTRQWLVLLVLFLYYC